MVDLQELARRVLGELRAKTHRRELDQLQPLLRHDESVQALAVAYHWARPVIFLLTDERCLILTKKFFRRYRVTEFCFSGDRVFKISRHGGKYLSVGFYSEGTEPYLIGFGPDTPNRTEVVREIANLTLAGGGKVIADRNLDSEPVR